ncbi:MAG: metallophosphoesterase [Lentisphaeria bacterium]|nr:metallophosphoesterase [Lentisphaeria bacterium]
MNTVKFSVFADLHYRAGNWNWAGERLGEILARAEREKVDFIMHCGDFCHNVVAARPVIDRYNAFHIPARHTMGNHDFEETDTVEAVTEAYRMGDRSYYCFDCNGFRFISIDTNFHRAPDGSVAHYASSDVYTKCHQKELLIPEEEMAFLRDALRTAPGPCVVFSHGSIVRPNGVANREEVLELLREERGRVLLWINGHHHRNNLQLVENVAFFDLNSTTSDWVNTPHDAYPPELMAKFALSRHELLFEKPVHAVVTVAEDGEIRIDGMRGGMYMGVTRAMTGNPECDCAGLPCDASVLSARFRLLN